MKNFFKAASVLIVLLLSWQIVCSLNIWSAYVLPGPQKVWKAFIAMVISGEILQSAFISLRRVLIGFGIAFVSAFLIGILTSLKPKYTPYYNHIVEFLRNVPPMSLIPLLILWFGIGETAKIVIIVLTSFFPIFLNTKSGFASCDQKLLEVGDSLGFTAAQKFFKIRLPNAIPSILVGMRIGLGYSWRAIVGAEMIAAASGLGYLILDAQQMARSDKVIVGILVIGILGYCCDRAFYWLIKKISHGGVGNSWS